MVPNEQMRADEANGGEMDASADRGRCEVFVGGIRVEFHPCITKDECARQAELNSGTSTWTAGC